MKTIIRKSVWETNSSSTHSFTYCKSDISVFDVISKLIEDENYELNPNFSDANYVYQEEDSDERYILINKIPEPNGDESVISLTRIHSFPAKISFLYMLAYDYAWEYLNKQAIGYHKYQDKEYPIYDTSIRKMKQLVEENEVGKAFIEATVKLAKSNGYAGIKFSEDFDAYDMHSYECMWDDTNRYGDFLSSIDNMINMMKNVLKEDEDVVWSDMPYSLYGSGLIQQIITV